MQTQAYLSLWILIQCLEWNSKFALNAVSEEWSNASSMIIKGPVGVRSSTQALLDLAYKLSNLALITTVNRKKQPLKMLIDR